MSRDGYTGITISVKLAELLDAVAAQLPRDINGKKLTRPKVIERLVEVFNQQNLFPEEEEEI